MNSHKEYPRINLLGIDLHAMCMEDVLRLCQERIERRERLLIGVVNVAKAVCSRRDERLRDSLKSADIVLADGAGIVWLSKMVGATLPERVAGIDLMLKLLEISDAKGYRVYFLGARKVIIEKVVEIVKQRFPGLVIAGFRDGYFSESQNGEVAEQVRKSKADILFVAMSSPKKETFLKEWCDYMNVHVCHGVGGSFDVLAGATKRAPLWMQKCGLEWFYRFLQEPGRMWKRYLVTNTLFIVLGFKAVMTARLAKLYKQ